MADPINLADPACEPTDEQLTELSARAFAGVGAAHQSALAKLRREIAEAREHALRSLDAWLAARTAP